MSEDEQDAKQRAAEWVDPETEALQKKERIIGLQRDYARAVLDTEMALVRSRVVVQEIDKFETDVLAGNTRNLSVTEQQAEIQRYREMVGRGQVLAIEMKAIDIRRLEALSELERLVGADGFNAAVDQSETYLRDYLKELILNDKDAVKALVADDPTGSEDVDTIFELLNKARRNLLERDVDQIH